MVGYFVASNQSALFACLFCMPLPVLILFTSMFTSKREAARFCSSKAMEPVKVLKMPLTPLVEKVMLYFSVMAQLSERVMANTVARRPRAAMDKNVFFIVI